MVRKKGYVRTLEAFIAVVITFIFMTYALPPAVTTQSEKDLGIMDMTYRDPRLRTCVMGDDQVNCTSALIGESMPSQYEHVVMVRSAGESFDPDLPEKKVFTEAVYLAGNLTHQDPTIIRVYYWLS